MARTRDQAERRRAHLAKIHIAKKWASVHLGMSDDDYRALVGAVMSEVGDVLLPGKQPSARYLGTLGRSVLLRRFRALGWPDETAPGRELSPTEWAREADADPAAHRRAARRRKGQTNGRYPVPGTDGHLTQAQADYLAHLEDLLDWTDDSSRLLGFIERQLGARTFVAALTRHQATVLVTGLEYVAGLKNPKTKAQERRWGRVAEEERQRQARARGES